jgi:ABC-type antimicrobial peptide transport system permease subunit
MVGKFQPLTMGGTTGAVFTDKTTELLPANSVATAYQYNITPEYLRAAGTGLVAGRNIRWQDDAKSPRVAVVNQEFARQLFGSVAGAIGGHFKMKDGTRIEVVGIVEDGKYFNLAEEPQPAMFLPIQQFPSDETWMVVRSDRDPQALSAAIRERLRGVDAGLPVDIQPWSQELGGALFASRVATVSLGVLGGMGAMLAITGIFGMAAYSVSKRLREMGIRIALGAQRIEVLQAVLGRPLMLLLVGSAAGLALGLLGTRVLAFLVYQATPRDPLVLGGVVLAMLVLGMAAIWIPAQRALSVNPLMLLREE